MQTRISELLGKFEEKRGKIDLSLHRVKQFLEKLGSPHIKTPPVIHFAGTNGKGSTIAFLKAMIEGNGQTCHVYTSPHLVRFNERIVIGGKEISDDFLYDILSEVEKQAEDSDVTFFEITTAAAFLAFSQTPADFLLLETGLGGRLDTTNVIPSPLLTAITPISHDHMEFLGSTLAEIAKEKAGIMKRGVPCISTPQEPEAQKVIEDYAGEMDIELEFSSSYPDLPPLALPGEHQRINASLAVDCARKIGLSGDAVTYGLQSAKWRARLQMLNRGKLAALVPKFSALWLDGAHNTAGAKALAEFFRNSHSPFYLVLGMMERKSPEEFLRHFSGMAKTVYTVKIDSNEPSHDAEKLAEIARSLGFDAKPVDGVERALIDIAISEHKASNILVAGSLYLAGQVLAQN